MCFFCLLVPSQAQWIQNENLPPDEFFGDSDDYAEAYELLFNESPTYYAAQASVAGYMMQLALGTVADITDQSELQTVLYDLEPTPTFYGTVDFEPNTGRNYAKEQVVTQINNGHIVNVASKGFEEAELSLVYPIPYPGATEATCGDRASGTHPPHHTPSSVALTLFT